MKIFAFALVCAIIEAVDTYPELLRMAASCYGNDYRLGADEALQQLFPSVWEMN